MASAGFQSSGINATASQIEWKGVAEVCDDATHRTEDTCTYLHEFISKAGAAFVHIPKNAGTTIEDACEMSQTAHWPAYAQNECTEPPLFSQTPSFAVLREPVDRAISLVRTPARAIVPFLAGQCVPPR